VPILVRHTRGEGGEGRHYVPIVVPAPGPFRKRGVIEYWRNRGRFHRIDIVGGANRRFK